ncbi:MAG: universal stress protein [Deltaproteobacteria bacterium]|nr:universal stress protein [Deltaproteobacteria bacterium]
MAKQKILLNYSYSNYGMKALDFIIRTFASNPEVQVTIMHTYPPLPAFEADVGPMPDRLKASLNLMSQVIVQNEEGVKVARQHLISNGFSEGNVDYIFKCRHRDVADEIIETANNGNFDIIVMAPRPAKITGLFKKRVSTKVASVLKDKAIILVT